MAQTQVIKINFRAGIVSPGTLLQVLELAAASKVQQVRFGSRQQVLLHVPKSCAATFAAQCAGISVSVSTAAYATENIVSSYAAAGIFIKDGWLKQGIYKEVFDLFDQAPKLKINITDSTQTFVPLFTGNINWIASSSVHFWYLYIRFPKSNHTYRCPDLIYTNHLAAVSACIETQITVEKMRDSSAVFESVKKTISYISKPLEHELQLPKFHLPYYEGFNTTGADWWLGLYRRNETVTLDFLKELCALCLQTKIGEIYITSWKTLIIKGIEKMHRSLWDAVLGKHRINVRHAANELAWLVEDNCEEGLVLKRQIIRYFDKEDVRTYGLCFSIKMKPGSGMFGSVVIRKEAVKNPGRLKTLDRFNLSYTGDFNPNSNALTVFREGVKKEHLGPYVVSLCKQYYEAAAPPVTPVAVATPETVAYAEQQRVAYQCRHCLTVYDETFGDPDQQIPAGTRFQDISSDYCCPLCEAGKEDIIPMASHQFVSG